MNAIRVLVEQHRAIEALFDELVGETRTRARVRAGARLTEELIAHVAAEENVFYPAARRALRGASVSSSPIRDEHLMLRSQLRRVLATSVHEPAFAPRLAALRLIFEHHVHGEETDVFPRVETALGLDGLAALGEELVASRPPVWVVMTENSAFLRSRSATMRSGVSLPATR